jgi:hypothetical protein
VVICITAWYLCEAENNLGFGPVLCGNQQKSFMSVRAKRKYESPLPVYASRIELENFALRDIPWSARRRRMQMPEEN